MKQCKLFQKPMLLAPFLVASTLCFSQVTRQWVKRYDGPSGGTDIARAIAVDDLGNVYVTGSSDAYIDNGNGTGGYSIPDYATIKYDAAGNEVWIRRYGSLRGSDDAADVAVDAAGNVYVTGSSDGRTSEASVANHDMTTVKYDASGNEVWVRRYSVANNDNDGPEGASAVAVDATGNVYVTGYIGGGSKNYVTIKYDTAGNVLWTKTYDSGSGDAIPAALVLDGSGNVYVTGRSSTTDGSVAWRYTTVKYNMNGTELWIRDYSNANEDAAGAHALAVDGSGNVYVTGDIGTIKYNATGTLLWGVSGFGSSLAVDGSGNVYVIGSATIKYDAAGTQLWRKDARSESRSVLALDGFGNVYVAGNGFSRSYNDPDISFYDYATRKYDTAGNQLWEQFYDGDYSYDEATSLVVDGAGNVYVTGYSENSGINDYATIKYSQTEAAHKVSSFTLINADSNGDVRELKEGDTINLEALATLSLNIRANTSPAKVGSVVFSLSGAATRNSTENIVPYALFADNNNGDYYSWTPTNGNYTLTALPYRGSKGTGNAGTPLTIHFTVTGQVVSSLILVNAETDQDIKTLQNGDVIDLAALPTRNLNIRAVVHPDTTGSVMFNLNNKVIVRENVAPYAIGGDIKGNYRPWTLPTGNHTLTATPYALAFGKGKKGKAHSVAFTVVDMAAIVRPRVSTGQQKSIGDIDQGADELLRANPNPFAGQTTIYFLVPKSGHTLLEVYDLKGAVVERLYDAQAEAGKGYTVSFNSKQLAGGMYMVKLTSGKQVQSYKLVLLR